MCYNKINGGYGNTKNTVQLSESFCQIKCDKQLALNLKTESKKEAFKFMCV